MVVIQEAVVLPRNQGRVLVSKLPPRKVVSSQHPSQNLHQLLPGGASHPNGRRICQIIMVSKFSYTQHRRFCRTNTYLSAGSIVNSAGLIPQGSADVICSVGIFSAGLIHTNAVLIVYYADFILQGKLYVIC